LAERFYAPVNVCIYCSAERYAPDSSRFLAAEHILPLGLDGDIVIPRASCRACERTINQFEQPMMRGMLLGSRTLLGLRTRSPKDRPKHLPLFTGNGSTRGRVMVEIDDYPACILMPLLGRPTAIDAPGTRPGQIGIWHHFLRPPNHRLLKAKYGLGEWATPSIDNLFFAKMLAKIAHGSAVAEFGLGSFEPLLLEIILGDGMDKDPFRYIGGGPDIETQLLHRTEVGTHEFKGERYAAARIRLFGALGSPSYFVLAGRIPEGAPLPTHRGLA
jgi:hypothetical protein